MIDLYLAGDYVAATRALDGSLQQGREPEVSAALARIRQDLGASRAGSDERRQSVRRLQGAVLVPLESLLPLSARVADDPRFIPLEQALRQGIDAVAAVERSTEPALGAFRAWAQVGLMQFLLNTGRVAEAEQVGQGMRLPRQLPDLQAEHDLLRGVVRERTARIVTGGASGGQTFVVPEAVGAQGAIGSGSAAGGVTGRVDRAVLARRYWASAARWYERVLDARPSHPEARLRLARTWLDRGEADRALTMLAPLVTPPCASSVCALAVLFTGEAYERRGKVGRAAESYRAASADARTRQSAVLALLGLSLPDDAEQGLVLARTLAGSSAPTDDLPDAWSVYVGGRRDDVEAVLGPLRRGLRP
ncbi:lipopolysaccharide assembly protein LapB [Luteitalea sp. TBR-22]|uniref:tetratricopeptide repeat protein n=1 Tax=Luteitalea sp. TBR-22 TaxID=2802971 RepID=UPI001EF5622A|nr:tetratricopeptide repeat protein [Luteitalea sp. TBR-22]